ncbi:MAG TPA: DHHA1 domain-containing protein, partial [Gemmatimonadales bacterium]
QAAAELTASPAELLQLIHGMRTDLKARRTESEELHGELDRLKARELYFGIPPGSDGIRRVLCRDVAPLDRLKGLGQAVAALPLALFVGATSEPPALIVAASRDSGVDAGKVLKSLLADAGGRGGGSAGLAQGVLPQAALLESVIGSLLKPGGSESK